MRTSRAGAWLLAASLLDGCFPAPVVRLPPPDPRALPAAEGAGPARNLVLFFDGTDSGPVERSNVYKLYERVVAEGRADVSTFYIEGIGVGFKPVGSATGWGIDYRLLEAYAFLLEHHRPGDRIHLFGFSRGAYAARILAAVLYFAGLPEGPGWTCPSPQAEDGLAPFPLEGKDCRWSVAERVYVAYKGSKGPEERIEEIRRALDELGLRFSRPVRVSTLGLWDTVEALGLVDTVEAIKVELGLGVRREPGERNRRYGDQLCNVDRAFHAVAIDDNRADVYTPKLLTLPHLFRNCEARDPSRDSGDFSRVEEVWFSGAHGDVGGSYLDCEYGPACISNVSLNWMIERLVREGAGVLHDPARLEADELSATHDGENGSLIYRRTHRDVRALVKGSRYNGGRAKIHCSVIERLAVRSPRCHEYGWGFRREGCPEGDGAGDGQLEGSGGGNFDGSACFEPGEDGLRYAGSGDPARACSDPALRPEVPGCWFTVVR